MTGTYDPTTGLYTVPGQSSRRKPSDRTLAKLNSYAQQQGRMVAGGKGYLDALFDTMRLALLWGCAEDDRAAEDRLGAIIADVADACDLAAQRRIQGAIRPLIQKRSRSASILAAAGRANLAVLHWPIVLGIVGAEMRTALHAARRQQAAHA